MGGGRRQGVPLPWPSLPNLPSPKFFGVGRVKDQAPGRGETWVKQSPGDLGRRRICRAFDPARSVGAGKFLERAAAQSRSSGWIRSTGSFKTCPSVSAWWRISRFGSWPAAPLEAGKPFPSELRQGRERRAPRGCWTRARRMRSLSFFLRPPSAIPQADPEGYSISGANKRPAASQPPRPPHHPRQRQPPFLLRPPTWRCGRSISVGLLLTTAEAFTGDGSTAIPSVRGLFFFCSELKRTSKEREHRSAPPPLSRLLNKILFWLTWF